MACFHPPWPKFKSVLDLRTKRKRVFSVEVRSAATEILSVDKTYLAQTRPATRSLKSVPNQGEVTVAAFDQFCLGLVLTGFLVLVVAATMGLT